ncbi:MAG TPA: cytochrome c oxidase subunit 3 [Steroidobacteraceae bacterium]|nr:cytochrome c oxidase subunit 3 [Steroidobacteraceae bacterium]
MTAAAQVADQYDDAGQQRYAATLGMWVFLATEILFFGVLFASYAALRFQYDQGFAVASRHTDMLLGTLETGVLLTSSSLIALAVRAVRLNERRSAVTLMAATAALGLTFLVMHGFEYYKEYTEHLIPGIDFSQPGVHAHAVELFFCLYYCITGFHSLHVAIGVVVISTLAVRVARGSFGPHRYTFPELAALYWHLVDIIWIFVFPLLYLIGRGG